MNALWISVVIGLLPAWAQGALGWLKTRILVLSVVGVLILTAGVTGYLKGFGDADRAAEIRQLQNEIATLKIDFSIARKMEKEANLAIGVIDQHAAYLEGKVHDYELALKDQGKSDPGRACTLSESDARRLRELR